MISLQVKEVFELFGVLVLYTKTYYTWFVHYSHAIYAAKFEQTIIHQHYIYDEKSVTFTGACANEIIPSINRSFVYNSSKGKKERIGRMVQMHSNERDEIKEVRAGDIAAAIGFNA
jgi:hypothetical protein